MSILIQRAHIFDCERSQEGLFDLRIADGRIEYLRAQGNRAHGNEAGVYAVDARGAWLLPGLIDLHVHLRYRPLGFRGAPAADGLGSRQIPPCRDYLGARSRLPAASKADKAGRTPRAPSCARTSSRASSARSAAATSELLRTQSANRTSAGGANPRCTLHRGKRDNLMSFEIRTGRI